MNIKMVDCRVTDEALQQEVIEVLESGKFIGGGYVANFATDWAEYCNAKHCVPTASGSAALTAAIKATKPYPGALWIVPAFTFAATAFSVIEAGCRPLYVDVGPNGLLDQTMVKNALLEIGDQIFGIIPVHLYGQRMQLEPELLEKQVIEDACQAHGAVRSVQGQAACFSFYPSKNLGACGDAGAIITDLDGIAEFARTYINYGDLPGTKYQHVMYGTNARMDAIQAVILSHKLDYLDTWNEIRSVLADRYADNGVDSIATARPCAWHQYTILVDKPKQFQAVLKLLYDIETGIHYPYVLPTLLGGKIYRTLYNAEYLSEHVLSLPIGPHLSLEAVDYVSETIQAIARKEAIYAGVVWRLND